MEVVPMENGFIASLWQYNENITNGNMPQKQKDIINAALELFSQKGYSSTTTSSIAQKANVSEKTLFKYYPGKKDLFREVFYEAVLNFLGTSITDIFETEADVREKLFNLFILKFKEDQSNPRFFKLFTQEMLVDNDLRNDVIASLALHWMPEIYKSVEKTLDKNENADIVVTAFMISLFSNVVGYSMARTVIFPDADWDDEKYIQNIVDIMCYGLFGQKEQRAI